MKSFWWYLGAGIVFFDSGTLMPGAWLLLRPNGFEIAELVGTALLIGAAYLSPFARRGAAGMALAGTVASSAFLLSRVTGAGQERRLAWMVAAPALAVGGVVVWLAVNALLDPERAAEKQRSRRWLFVWTGVGAALVLTWFWPWRNRRDPSRYLVPESYVGWVIVEYGVPGAAPLPVDHGAREYAIPLSGRLRTSSRQEYGFALDDWESVDAAGVRTKMVDPDGHGARVWRWSGGSFEQPGKPVIDTEQFFVGSEEQFNALGEKTYPEGP